MSASNKKSYTKYIPESTIVEILESNINDLNTNDNQDVKNNNRIDSNAELIVDEKRIKEMEEFLSFHEIIINKKKRRLLLTMTDKSFSSFKLGIVISRCCKSMNLDKAYEAFLEAKKNDIQPSNETYSNLLSLTSGLGDQGSSLAPPREIEPPQNIDAAFVVYKEMKSINFPFNEASYTAIIRCCCLNNREIEGYNLYKDMQKFDINPKLRTYQYLLQAFANVGDSNIGFELFNELVEKYQLPPSEREYINMLKLTCNTKDKRFFDILHSMMEDVLVPTFETWDIVKKWFENIDSNYIVNKSEITNLGIVTINNEQLLSVDLDIETKNALLEQIERFSLSLQSKISTNSVIDPTKIDNIDKNNNSNLEKKPKRQHTKCNDELRKTKWDSFKVWLDEKKNSGINNKPAFDIIIDGANVGFFKQNFAGAPSHVDYNQCNWMVKQLEDRGYHPLLVLHCRHLYPNIIPRDYVNVVEEWKSKNILLETPAGCNDDWFWLYTAVSLNCKVVTNDEMRDHHFQMLSPRFVIN